MANVVRLKVRPLQDLDLATLCRRLSDLEMAYSPDEATMDAILDAQKAVLAAISQVRCGSLAELAQKVSVISRRAHASDGFLGNIELSVLGSLGDELRQFGLSSAFA